MAPHNKVNGVFARPVRAMVGKGAVDQLNFRENQEVLVTDFRANRVNTFCPAIFGWLWFRILVIFQRKLKGF